MQSKQKISQPNQSKRNLSEQPILGTQQKKSTNTQTHRQSIDDIPERQETSQPKKRHNHTSRRDKLPFDMAYQLNEHENRPGTNIHFIRSPNNESPNSPRIQSHSNATNWAPHANQTAKKARRTNHIGQRNRKSIICMTEFEKRIQVRTPSRKNDQAETKRNQLQKHHIELTRAESNNFQ